ncbi:MAG: phage integrase SAM-like domain-containing protein, partial [Bacteroidaceae bacterium]
MDFIFRKSQKKDSNDYGCVYARIRGKGINKKYSLGFTMKSTEWNKVRQLKYTSTSYIKSVGIKYEQFFNILLRVKTAFENEFNPSTARPTINHIKATCANKQLQKNPLREAPLLRDYIQQYIEQLQNGQRLKWRRAVKVSEGYIANHKSALRAILDYEREKQTNISLNKVSTSFQRNFVAFLRDRKLSPNTINTRMRSIRIIMQAAHKDKLIQNEDFRSNEFVPIAETTDDIFLNRRQINQMMNFDIKSACLL